MKHRILRSKKYKLFILFFLYIITPICEGMEIVNPDEEERPKIGVFNQSTLANENFILTDENPDSSLELLLIDSDTQPNKTTTLIKEINEVSNSYMLAFRDDSEENTSKFLTCKFIASLVGGCVASIPQIAIALNVGEHYGSNIYGYYLVGSTVFTVGGVSAWMIWEFIDDTQKLIKTLRDHQANASTCQFIKGTGIGVFSLILGALSSSADVYKTYKYNEIKELSIISFIYDIIPRTLGFYKLFFSLNFNSNKMCEQNSLIKNRGLEFIDLSKVSFLNKCKENGVEEISETLMSYTTPEEIFNYLSSDFRNFNEATQDSENLNGANLYVLGRF